MTNRSESVGAAAHQDSIPASLSEETRAALALSLVPQVGPQLQQTLVQHFGSATAVLRAAPSAIREVSGVGATVIADQSP